MVRIFFLQGKIMQKKKKVVFVFFLNAFFSEQGKVAQRAIEGIAKRRTGGNKKFSGLDVVLQRHPLARSGNQRKRESGGERPLVATQSKPQDSKGIRKEGKVWGVFCWDLEDESCKIGADFAGWRNGAILPPVLQGKREKGEGGDTYIGRQTPPPNCCILL